MNTYDNYNTKRVDKTNLKQAISKMVPGTRWPWVKVADGRGKNSPLLCIIASILDFNDLLNENERLKQRCRTLEKAVLQIDRITPDTKDVLTL